MTNKRRQFIKELAGWGVYLMLNVLMSIIPTIIMHMVFALMLEYDLSIRLTYWVCFILMLPMTYVYFTDDKEEKANETKKEEI
ncbi:hypothetical protein BC01_122 [Bacillus phage BC01]|nr:hypothetical protein PBC6_110 [Bacillus phage PBC6]AXU41219.1 hypothetical protein BC01_122 [Bacillus phage BC01]